MSGHFFVAGVVAAGDRGGVGRLRGVVHDEAGNPVSRNVVVLVQNGWGEGRPWLHPINRIARIKSEPSNGAWQVKFLDENAHFTVIAYDDAGNFDPVIKADLKPEPME